MVRDILNYGKAYFYFNVSSVAYSKYQGKFFVILWFSADFPLNIEAILIYFCIHFLSHIHISIFFSSSLPTLVFVLFLLILLLLISYGLYFHMLA